MSDDSTESAEGPRPRKRHRPAAAPVAVSSDEPRGPATWRERHAATVMGAVLGGLLIMIMLVQAC